MMWQYIQRQPNSKQYFVAGYWGILFHGGGDPVRPKVKDTTGLYNQGPLKTNQICIPPH